MSSVDDAKDALWVKREPGEWSPKIRVILTWIIGVLALSPAILGLYWELLLPK